MNRLISSVVIAAMLSSNVAWAKCDFGKDIKKNANGTYTYTEGCHIEVGKVVKKSKTQEKRIEKLEKVIELKDLALVKSHERTQLWMDTTIKLEDRVNTIERVNDTQKVLYFVGGVLLTGLAVWGAGQLR